MSKYKGSTSFVKRLYPLSFLSFKKHMLIRKKIKIKKKKRDICEPMKHDILRASITLRRFFYNKRNVLRFTRYPCHHF